jgi:amino acid transporter
MFIVGLVFVGGGAIFTFQAFEDAKNVFETLIFALMGVAVGLTLCVWTFTGPPG